jgi:hypothetical protein
MSNLVGALDRTLRLMRDEVGDCVDDMSLVDVLTTTRVALVADEANINSHAAQTALVSAAMLMARSAHKVHLVAPDVPLIGPQPPLRGGQMIEQLMRVGRNMLPDVGFAAGQSSEEFDLAIGIGDSPINVRARRRLRVNAEPWAGIVAPEDHMERWMTPCWPLGALAAAGLAAGEAFKVAMRKLLPVSLNRSRAAALFAETDGVRFVLAPPGTPYCTDLGNIDFVSAGAITNAALYVIARILGVSARGRIIDPQCSELTNLNRYMLLLRSQIGDPKACQLAKLLGGGLRFEPIIQLYEPGLHGTIGPFAPAVVVGVDDIPTRWAVQRTNPEWLAVGATTHWSAMASFHEIEKGCAQCLHPIDEPGDAPIQTTATVSYWAGLLAATYVMRHAGRQTIPTYDQQIFVTPFRPENPFRAPVPFREDCPTCRTAADRALPGAAA